jgi:2-iminobutanoate/2-iminopropanoate deaminase
MKKIINTPEAPAPIGPYSQAVISGNTLYISGQIAIDPSSGNLVMENIEKETHQVMKNLNALLKAGGSSFDQVLKTSIFLKDMKQFGPVNEIYGSYFSGSFPARETVQVSVLPKEVNVEISMIAEVTG